jgi:ATP-binding cassette subfamily F protein 2
MVSASKAKREAERAAKAAAAGKEVKPKKTLASRASKKGASENTSAASSVNGDDEVDAKLQRLKLQEDESGISDRVTTGVLASLEASRDIKITSASLVFHGKVLFNDSTIEINFGRRYGLLGENGCGKSTLLKALAAREFPVPGHVDIYLLNEPADATDYSALEYVVKQAENELARLEKLAEDTLERDGGESPELEHLYEVCLMCTPLWLFDDAD